MEMQIDAKVIRDERSKRAWSQEHLAAAAGLGLRTVQRIEATGTASNESIIALAAVFSIPVSKIKLDGRDALKASSWLRARRRLAGTSTLLLACVFSFVAVRSSFAEQILLDIGLSFDEGQRELKTRMAIDDGESEELELEDVFRFLITPTVTEDDHILIAVEVFEFDGTEYVKTQEPRVVTEDGTTAVIAIGRGENDAIHVLLTPERE